MNRCSTTYSKVLLNYLLIKIAFLIICMAPTTLLYSQNELNEANYVFFDSDGYKFLDIQNGITNAQFLPFEADGNYMLNITDGHLSYSVKLDTSFQYPSNSEFKKIGRIAALSDIHGQYRIMKHLLIKHKIIDDSLKWTFGKGHLVITGDVFDRGEEVNEILWFLYKLENEALKNGGQVHLLLGNHEIMVLEGDLRYIHPRYVKVCELFGITYEKLYARNTVLGKWLRSKPIIISINDILFVHAGISETLAHHTGSIDQINDGFLNNLIDSNLDSTLTDTLFNLLYLSEGPVWYRGYFDEKLMTKEKIKTILDRFDKKAIVVGHTSFPEIKSLYGHKIIAIDSSIKLGKSGEILLIENGKYYRGSMDGSVEKIK